MAPLVPVDCEATAGHFLTRNSTHQARLPAKVIEGAHYSLCGEENKPTFFLPDGLRKRR
jgi:hypothetical protein